MPRPSSARRSVPLGFTLIEVILAITIGAALLIAALLFYRQAADLRGAILTESDRLANVRLVLDRIAADLRSAQALPGRDSAFSGGNETVSFARTAVTLPPPGSTQPASDLTRVTYTTVRAQEGTNLFIAGLNRLELPLGAPRPPGSIPGAATTGLSPAAPLATMSSNRPFGSLEATNQPGEMIADAVRFVRFRYWDGASWLDSWTNGAPPPGMEIILSGEPAYDETAANLSSSATLPAGSAAGTSLAAGPAAVQSLAPGQFRRVVFLPAGRLRRRLDSDPFSAPLQP